jgi:ribose transport system substrate-binding protein
LLVLLVVALPLLSACGSESLPASDAFSTPTPPLEETRNSATRLPSPDLVLDRMGTAEDLEPTKAEVDSALRTLGGGFIGIVACTLESEYHSTVAKAAQERAAQLGIRTEVFDSAARPETQVPAIEDFVSKGARVLVLCVLDPQRVQSAVMAATNRGITIVQYAGRESSGNGISVSIEESDLGCAAGEIAGDLIAAEKGGKATVAILDYPDLPSIVRRTESMERCLTSRAPEARVVCCFLGATEENGRKSMAAVLKSFPDVDVVASINDAGAYGAIAALEAAGKDPQSTFVVGIDGEARALDLLQQGKYYRGTVDTSPAATGLMSINGAIKLLSGATVPKSIRVSVRKITPDTLK